MEYQLLQYGIPTVVESAVLVNDCLDLFIEKLQQEAKSNDYLNKLKEQDNYEEIKEALNPSDYNMIVTPKEIDELIENMSSIVARGINMSLWIFWNGDGSFLKKNRPHFKKVYINKINVHNKTSKELQKKFWR